jgi:hypothetical protein
MNNPRTRIVASLIILIIVCALILRNYIHDFTDLDLTNFDAGGVIGLIMSLFFISLLVERFVEIFIEDPKKAEKDSLQAKLNILSSDRSIVVNKEDKVLSCNSIFPDELKVDTSGDKELILNNINVYKNQLVDELNVLKRKRRRIIIPVTYFIGLLLSMFGIRVVTDLITSDLTDLQNIYIGIMDMALSASIIAGGSDGIHELIKIVQRFAGIGGGGN